MYLRVPVQVARLDEEKARLTARASQFQNSCMALAAQLKETRDRWQATCATNANLQRELLTLRSEFSQWQVRCQERPHASTVAGYKQGAGQRSTEASSSTAACKCRQSMPVRHWRGSCSMILHAGAARQ